MQQPGPYAQAQRPYDPYRAEARPPGFSPIGSGARIAFAIIISLMGVAFLVAVVGWTAALIRADGSPGHQPDDSLMAVGLIGFFVLIFLLYAQIAAGLTWLYKAWSWLPWDQRYSQNWRGWISPSQAVLLMLVPYFHYYWMFVANCALCDALDRLRVSHPTRHPAPKNLAIAACVCQLLIPFPVGSVLWLIFMSKIDQMTREMSESIAPRSRNAF